MKRRVAAVALLWMLMAVAPAPAHAAGWPGVDETVVEKYAAAAGRPARPPLFDPGEGDLRAFVFLIAGVAGGFVIGYYFRELFRRKGRERGTPR